MSVSEKHPCEDEKCAAFLTDSDDPYVCFHHHQHAEAIRYWGLVAKGELTIDDIIDDYREFLDFEAAEATDEMTEHYNDEMEWTGPTVSMEIRVDNEPVKEILVYPVDSYGQKGYDTAMAYAQGYAEALQEADGRVIAEAHD